MKGEKEKQKEKRRSRKRKKIRKLQKKKRRLRKQRGARVYIYILDHVMQCMVVLRVAQNKEAKIKVAAENRKGKGQNTQSQISYQNTILQKVLLIHDHACNL